jgi:ATP-dependent RNA helicase DeaD
VELSGSGGSTQHADIAHTACLTAEHLHTKALVNFLLLDEPSGALIFTKRKQQAEDVAEVLREAGLSAEHLHGDLAQATRNRILASFKEGKLRYLVATDVAARGLDVEALPLVIHMGIPTQMESYIHRSGRTGRAGLKGTSLALVDFKESRILLAWGRRGGLKLDWRPAPTQEQIAEGRVKHLQTQLEALEAPEQLELAKLLLGTRPAAELVAALLSLVQKDGHGGFFIPEPPKVAYKTEKPARPRFSESSFGPRAEGSRPAGPRDERPTRPYQERPTGPRKADDKAFGPRKPFNKVGKPAFEKRGGEPFKKKKG